MIMFWKRTIPIVSETTNNSKSDCQIDVKFKKNESQLFFDNNDHDKNKLIIND